MPADSVLGQVCPDQVRPHITVLIACRLFSADTRIIIIIYSVDTYTVETVDDSLSSILTTLPVGLELFVYHVRGLYADLVTIS